MAAAGQTGFVLWFCTEHSWGGVSQCCSTWSSSSPALCWRMPLLRAFSAEELIFSFLCDSIRGLTWSVFLSSTIKVDDFTAQLFRIYMQVLEEGLAQVPWQGIPVVCAPWHCGGGARALAARFGTMDSELSLSQADHSLCCDVLSQPVSSGPRPVEQLSSLVGTAGNSLAWSGRI